MSRTRPPNAGKGRRKGSKNKIGVALKDMILQALSEAGGVAYLQAQAKKHPGAFLALIGRVLPLQVKTDGAEPRMPQVVTHVHEHVDK